MELYGVKVWIFLEAENYVDARYKFEAALPDGWAADIEKLEKFPEVPEKLARALSQLPR